VNHLTRILARTRADLEARKRRVPLAALQVACQGLQPARSLAAALRRPEAPPRRGGPLRAIAEVKKASPSRGVIREDFHPADLARAYAQAGAQAVSVLTDTPFFQGSLEHLQAARRATEVPLLRKDFHVDPYQLWEARAAGADAVLLIVAALHDAALGELLALSATLGLSPLVEVHSGGELERALAAGATVIGINNRDLTTFDVSLQTTSDLLPQVPRDAVVVSESGIARPEEAARLAAAGVDAILVGEGLLRHADPGEALRRLMGGAGSSLIAS
jgi:indole-3-glycerol phosphate synthase